MVNICTVYEINLGYIYMADFMLSNSLFRTVEVTKNVDTDKYSYSGYGIGFDAHRSFSLFNGSVFDKNVIFGADMSSSVHIVNKKEDMLILVKGPTDVLDDTMLTAEKEYSINFTKQQ